MNRALNRDYYLVYVIWLVVLIWSGINPKDRMTWWLEVAPVLLAVPALALTQTRSWLPRFILFWILLHGIVLMVGGKYTYAEVPFGFWLQELFGFERNPYDRIGHLFQGFVPALLTREILVRNDVVKNAGWLFFLTVTVCMAISVTYEFLEWAAAIIMNEGADAFLGTQGDEWDTQWDMFLATVGAISALLIFPAKRSRS